MRLRFVTLLACTVALGLGTAGLSSQERAPYSAIVVFGTSLSDSGNAARCVSSMRSRDGLSASALRLTSWPGKLLNDIVADPQG